ncbi:hypothetical protein Mapa_005930 [Marchantia paleacea]|nr:hypothetical protein Mapa_005930 [Marchantia paleacea]
MTQEIPDLGRRVSRVWASVSNCVLPDYVKRCFNIRFNIFGFTQAFTFGHTNSTVQSLLCSAVSCCATERCVYTIRSSDKRMEIQPSDLHYEQSLELSPLLCCAGGPCRPFAFFLPFPPLTSLPFHFPLDRCPALPCPALRNGR